MSRGLNLLFIIFLSVIISGSSWGSGFYCQENILGLAQNAAEKYQAAQARQKEILQVMEAEYELYEKLARERIIPLFNKKIKDYFVGGLKTAKSIALQSDYNNGQLAAKACMFVGQMSLAGTCSPANW